MSDIIDRYRWPHSCAMTCWPLTPLTVTKKIIHKENQEVRSGKTEGKGSGWVGERRRTPGLDEELTGRCRRCGRAVDGKIVEVTLYLLASVEISRPRCVHLLENSRSALFQDSPFIFCWFHLFWTLCCMLSQVSAPSYCFRLNPCGFGLPLHPMRRHS